jgi:hypothetical protein
VSLSNSPMKLSSDAAIDAALCSWFVLPVTEAVALSSPTSILS